MVCPTITTTDTLTLTTVVLIGHLSMGRSSVHHMITVTATVTTMILTARPSMDTDPLTGILPIIEAVCRLCVEILSHVCLFFERKGCSREVMVWDAKKTLI